MSLKDVLLLIIGGLMILMGIGNLLGYDKPDLTCVNGKQYEVTKNMLIFTGKECLTIDKE